MSHFQCEFCDTILYDSPTGYITECEHYKIEKKPKPLTIHDALIAVSDAIIDGLPCYSIDMEFKVEPKDKQ